MNHVTPERKERVLKSLAVFGLLGIVVFIAWVSIQIVAVFPAAVQSLATLAETVYTYNPNTPGTISITPTTSTISSGTAHTLHWKQPLTTGTYTFKYNCHDGVAVEIATSENTYTEAECNKKYTLGAVNQAEIFVYSEKQAEVQFEYTLGYFKTNAIEESMSAQDSFTVRNDRLAEGVQPESPAPIVTPEDKVPAPEPDTTTPTTPTKVPTLPPTTEPTYTYSYIPVSDAKGFTDLSITYLGIGQKNSAGKFINNGLLFKGVAGAIQFSVKNTGTKTSADWSFTAKLPGAVSYKTITQSPLKPNERATFIVAFPAVLETELQKFSVTVTTEDDSDQQNNTITGSTIVLQ